MKGAEDVPERMRSALSQAHDPDGESRKKLVTLDCYIRVLPKKREHAPFACAGLPEAVRALAVRLAQAHPNLALPARQLADMLGKIGV